jgi:ATP-dependent Clp protease ATP-binding subunit ClpX
LLARALAHALEVPFAAADSSGLVETKHGREEVLPPLLGLLHASEFDVEAAQQGVLYLDGVDRPDAQEALLHLWQGQVVESRGRLSFDIRGVLFVCGGTFTGLAEAIARSGRHPEQPVTAEVLVAAGARPQWVSHLAAIARAVPLDEETLTHMVAWVDWLISAAWAARTRNQVRSAERRLGGAA